MLKIKCRKKEWTCASTHKTHMSIRVCAKDNKKLANPSVIHETASRRHGIKTRPLYHAKFKTLDFLDRLSK